MKPEEVEALQTKSARDRAMHAVEIREREDTHPGIRLLQPIGLLLIAVAIVWWITFYTKVGGIVLSPRRLEVAPLAWFAVGLPLLWGVWITVDKALILFG